MTILASLAKAYERLPDAPALGYSEQGIMGCFVIDSNGEVIGDPVLLALDKKGRPATRKMSVPYFGGRSGSKPPPYFLWDNTAYTLGISKKGFDASERFAAFKDHNIELLKYCRSTNLTSFVKFLKKWNPENLKEGFIQDYMFDRNIVFRHIDDRHFIHEDHEAKEIWTNAFEPDVIGSGICLISGEHSAIARLHPPISTFENPARIVSFDKDNDAFSSYGHVQAENAPTGVSAAFAYTTALNRFLERDSGHRVQIGDASTVFWADALDMAAAEEAEALFASFVDSDEDRLAEEKATAGRIGDKLARIRQGLPLTEVEPRLATGVRFYILGLAPNAARLSVRFFHADDFGALVRNYQSFIADMRVDPPPRDGYPPLWRYLQETAVLGKRENVPPNLAGEWMRSILSGTPYPLTLMASVLTRIRADGKIEALRAGMLKALLIRNFKMEVPVALDPENMNKGYLLGRLFAVYEQIQVAALGTRVNATIKDKFYGSASAQPRKVFHALDSGSVNHLSKVGKQRPGHRVVLEKQVAAIMDLMSPGDDPFPASLGAQEQALFGLGYYHQRSEFFRKPAPTTSEGEDA